MSGPGGTADGATTAAPTQNSGSVAVDSYLQVIDGGASWRHALPSAGEVTIGRVPGCDVVLADTAVSRQHVRIELAPGRATVVDQGSQNGTLVNNQRVSRQELVDGDVLTIGTAIVIFHCARAPAPAAGVVSASELRTQLDRELDRVVHHGSELALASIAVGDSERAVVERELLARLRPLDLIAWDGPQHVNALLPETDHHTVDAVLDELLAVLPGCRAGFAVAPRDGCDRAAVLDGARAAAASAEAGTRVSASSAARIIELGDRTAVVADAAMARVYGLVERLAATELSVLVYGETGTGKELVAAALHHLSPRAAAPRVAINCAALPETLVESELFGHERGAFSGAVAARPGIFEQAHGGTVFLDEVGELSPQVQAKLLRVLETRRVVRLGDVREIALDMRLVTATNRDLKEDIKLGRFRQDLYFRLAGAALWLPPLRDRPREIPILTRRFIDDAATVAGHEPPELTPAAIQRLATYAWPGNVRELKNVCDYLVAVAGSLIDDGHLDGLLDGAATDAAPVAPSPAQAQRDGSFRPLAEEIEALERRRITEALQANGGNQTRAARAIAMPLRTFLNKLKRYGILA